MATLMVTLSELLLILAVANLFIRANSTRFGPGSYMAFDIGHCLSWRVAVEANNAQGWRTVPPQCILYVEGYMLGGQYYRDLDLVINQMSNYLDEIVPADDGMDSWVFDIDETCLSNLPYYQGKHFGGDPFDPKAFTNWVQRGLCPAIPPVLLFYQRLIESGFKVFLITGRDEEVLGSVTNFNLYAQGFAGHERLIMRNKACRGQGASMFKSAVRKQLVGEGYRIRGNVGDQWNDLVGDCSGDRVFKIPNPMYYVP